MVGVLPSGIGIGAGAVVASADDLILEQLAAIERERKRKFPHDLANWWPFFRQTLLSLQRRLATLRADITAVPTVALVVAAP